MRQIAGTDTRLFIRSISRISSRDIHRDLVPGIVVVAAALDYMKLVISALPR